MTLYREGVRKILFIEGDCREKILELQDNSIDLIITSPPYFNSSHKYQRKKGYHYTKDIGEPLYTIEDTFELLIDKAKDSGFYAINLGFSYGETGVLRPFYIIQRALRFGWFCVDRIIWKKLNPIPINNRLTNAFEDIFILAKTPHPIYPNKELGYKHNIIECAVHSGSPTASFPIELPEFLINVFTTENNLVLDHFAGIGTTLLACKKLRRNYIGIELNGSYIKHFNKEIKKIKPINKMEKYY